MAQMFTGQVVGVCGGAVTQGTGGCGCGCLLVFCALGRDTAVTWLRCVAQVTGQVVGVCGGPQGTGGCGCLLVCVGVH